MFNKKIPVPTQPTDYPTGVCVTVEGNRYYINGKYRHPIVGTRIFESWRFPFVIKTSEEALTNYPTAGRLGFRDGSLVRSIKDGSFYFISQRLKRKVENPDILFAYQLTLKDALWVSADEINLHKDGEVLK